MGNSCASKPASAVDDRDLPPEVRERRKLIRSSSTFSLGTLSPIAAAHRRLALAKLAHLRLGDDAKAPADDEDVLAAIAALVVAQPLTVCATASLHSRHCHVC